MRDAFGNRAGPTAGASATGGNAASPGAAAASSVKPRGTPPQESPVLRVLMQRYGLSRDLAEQVAAEKLSLRAALATCAPKPPLVVMPPVTRKRHAGGLVAIGVCCGLAVLLLWQAKIRWDRGVTETLDVAAHPAVSNGVATDLPATAATHEAVPVELLRDPQGRVVRIVGVNPQSVFVAFCRASGLCASGSALELASNAGDDAGVRFGIYVDGGDRQGRWAIQIQREPRTSRWFVGDGRRPVTPVAADRLVLGHQRVALAPPRTQPAG